MLKWDCKCVVEILRLSYKFSHIFWGPVLIFLSPIIHRMESIVPKTIDLSIEIFKAGNNLREYRMPIIHESNDHNILM